MSFRFGRSSKARLETCHPELQRLFNSLIEDYDVTILCGHRNQLTQTAVYSAGASRVQWPKGKHNTLPSLAVDAISYPIDFDDVGTNYMFVGIVKERARALGIKLRCGADWDGDMDTGDQTLADLVHFELLL